MTVASVHAHILASWPSGGITIHIAGWCFYTLTPNRILILGTSVTYLMSLLLVLHCRLDLCPACPKQKYFQYFRLCRIQNGYPWECTRQLCELISEILLWFSCAMEWIVECEFVCELLVFSYTFLSCRNWCLCWSNIMCMHVIHFSLPVFLRSPVYNLWFHECTWIQEIKKKALIDFKQLLKMVLLCFG